MAAVYNALEEFVTQLAEEDPHYIVYPHNLSKYESMEDLPPPTEMADNLPDDIDEWLTYFPQAKPFILGGDTYTALLIGFSMPFPKLVKSLSSWMRNKCYSLWKAYLQSEQLCCLDSCCFQHWQWMLIYSKKQFPTASKIFQWVSAGKPSASVHKAWYQRINRWRLCMSTLMRLSLYSQLYTKQNIDRLQISSPHQNAPGARVRCHSEHERLAEHWKNCMHTKTLGPWANGFRLKHGKSNSLMMKAIFWFVSVQCHDGAETSNKKMHTLPFHQQTLPWKM